MSRLIEFGGHFERKVMKMNLRRMDQLNVPDGRRP
jgi:hypothetical protein